MFADARGTRYYDASIQNPTKGGTCGYGFVRPAVWRDGFILAPDDETYKCVRCLSPVMCSALLPRTGVSLVLISISHPLPFF